MEPKPDTTSTRVVVTRAGKLRQPHAKNAEPPEVSDYAPGEFVPWKEFRPVLARDLAPAKRTAGLHFAVLAPTRGGKTTLVTKGLIPIYRQADVPVLVVDSTDDPKLADYGDRMPRFGKLKGLHRIAISDLSGDSIRRVYEAMSKAYAQGDVLIYIDEIRHVCDPKFMGLGKAMENMWLFGGKRGVTIGGATQAPRWVPSAFYDQSQCHFMFRIRDIRSRKRIEEISGDTETLRPLLPGLPRYRFAYVSSEGDVVTSKYDL